MVRQTATSLKYTDEDHRPLGHYKLRRQFRVVPLSDTEAEMFRELKERIDKEVLYGTAPSRLGKPDDYRR